MVSEACIFISKNVISGNITGSYHISKYVRLNLEVIALLSLDMWHWYDGVWVVVINYRSMVIKDIRYVTLIFYLPSIFSSSKSLFFLGFLTFSATSDFLGFILLL